MLNFFAGASFHPDIVFDKLLICTCAYFLHELLVFSAGFSWIFIYSRYSNVDEHVLCQYFLLVCSLSFHRPHTGVHGYQVFRLKKAQFVCFSLYGSCFGIKSKESA